jgi:hypothetical protein
MWVKEENYGGGDGGLVGMVRLYGGISRGRVGKG